MFWLNDFSFILYQIIPGGPCRSPLGVIIAIRMNITIYMQFVFLAITIGQARPTPTLHHRRSFCYGEAEITNGAIKVYASIHFLYLLVRACCLEMAGQQ